MGTRARLARWLVFATILALAGAAYVLLLVSAPVRDIGDERRFGENTEAGGLHVYLEPVAVDAMRDAMTVRIGFVPANSDAEEPRMTPGRDITLVVRHDKEAARIDLKADQPFPVRDVELDLYDGSIVSYPFDAYRASLRLRAFEKQATEAAQKLLPTEVTVWERLPGFRLRAREQPGLTPGERVLTFDLQRGRAFRFFALAIYGAMVLLACSVLTIGGLVFVRIRRPEATLLGALGAAIFALPALRGAMPGLPPLGVWADLFIFLWAELVAVVALGLMVWTWARDGPRP